MRRPRILCYAVNGLGLGHLTRTMAIARQLRCQAPDAEIVFLTSSEAAHLCTQEGFASFKVPSRTARAVGQLGVGRYTRMVQSVSWSLINAFDPQLLLVDSFPAGTIQELLPLLRWNLRRVFVYREQQPSMASDPYFQSLLTQYHLIVVPHAPGELELPRPSDVPVVCTGPVLLRDCTDALPKDVARRALVGADDDARDLCYVNFGGGGDPEAERATTLALEALDRHPRLRAVVAPGPLARPGAAPSNVTIVDRFPIAPLFPGLDLAISAAGYNSHAELLHFGVPTVFVPLAKGLDDQPARVARTVAAGAAVTPTELSVDALDESITRLCATREAVTAAARRLVPENGACVAATSILQLLP